MYTVTANLIALGVDVKAKDIEGRTALHHASYHGKADIVKLLIDAGCNIHAVSILLGQFRLRALVYNLVVCRVVTSYI